MEIDYFYTLTPRQFDNILTGYRRKQDETLKHMWEQTRQIKWAVMRAYIKQGFSFKLEDAIEFPWDSNSKTELPDDERMAEMVREVEAQAGFWAKADKIKNKQRVSYNELVK